MSLPLDFLTDFNWKQPRALGISSSAFFLLPTTQDQKKYFHFKEKQLPPGRDGVEWDSDDGYAEVGNYQVDQQQVIVSSQLKHREGVQCMIHPHIISSKMRAFLTLKYYHSSPSIARQSKKQDKNFNANHLFCREIQEKDAEVKRNAKYANNSKVDSARPENLDKSEIETKISETHYSPVWLVALY